MTWYEPMTCGLCGEAIQLSVLEIDKPVRAKSHDSCYFKCACGAG